MSFAFCCCLLVFGYWRLNPEPQVFQAHTLPHELHPQLTRCVLCKYFPLIPLIVFNFNEVQLISYFFYGFTFVFVSKKALPFARSSILSMSSSSSFKVFFRSVVHFELIFVKCNLYLHSLFCFCMWMRSCSSTIYRKCYICFILLPLNFCKRS